MQPNLCGVLDALEISTSQAFLVMYPGEKETNHV